MEIIISDNYGAMSDAAANRVISAMAKRPNPLLCPASGDTPAGLFHEITRLAAAGKIDTSNWSFVALDEWVGMNGADEGSCRFNLDRQLFVPLNVSPARLAFFDGRSPDLEKECSQVESFIKEKGGIDACILGLGMNGHIGMNEPGTSPTLRSHVAELAEVTRKVGQKYFTKETTLEKGITLGLQTIMESREIILLVSGAKKAEVVRKFIQAEPSADFPATLLRSHPGLILYLDEAAAKLLSK